MIDNIPKAPRIFQVWTNDPTLQDDETGENTPRGERYIAHNAELGHKIMHSKPFVPRESQEVHNENMSTLVKAVKSKRLKISDTDKITLLVDKNPKKEGSSAYKRFALYFKSKTVKDFIKLGGTEADIRYDVKSENISLN